MIPILSGNVASALGGGYEVANSCRFNDGDAPKLNRTLGTATSRKKWTLSFWVKRGIITHQMIMTTASATAVVKFNASHQFQVTDDTGLSYITNRVFRDPSAWYHIVVAVDTTQASANRQKIYVNGTQETSFATSTAADADDETNINSAVDHKFASYDGSTDFAFDGYLAEVVFIDGSQEAATSFGEFDEDSPTIWKPKDVSGLTFGTNGFYLDFEDSANLGNDANGGTDWTETNLAATDQCTDTPTNNFATLNPLDNYYASHTFSEGNCKIVTHSGNMSFNTATIHVSSGKWYVEAKVIDNADSNYHHVGITETTSSATSNWIGVSATHYGLTGYDGKYWRNNSGTSYGISNTTNDIVGMYIDLDNNKLYFAKNGTVMNSGTGISITAAASTTNGYYLISYGDWENASTATWEVNFGNPTYSVSSSNSDPSGYGSFEYSTTITGDGSSKSFYALCTKNLAEFGG